MLTVFMRDGDHVYRTYNTTSRGCGQAVVRQQHPRPCTVRTSGGLGGLAARLAATPNLRVALGGRDTLEDRFRPWAALA